MCSDDANKKSVSGRLRSALSALSGRAARTEQNKARAVQLKLMYENFREILNLNDSTLQLIADMEDRLSGRVPFSFNMMIHRVRRAVMDTFSMVKYLNQIADGRYNDLFESLRRINSEIEAEYAGRRAGVVGPAVIRLANLRASDDALTGTKMANLGEVRSELGLNVPDGFAITTSAFTKFMTHNELWIRAERLEEVLEAFGAKVTAEACREVQAAIIAAPVPIEVETAILEAFDSLAGGEELMVAVRSSASGEDRAASHAGQYYTELNVGRGWLLDAYRWVVASSFGIEAVSYRLEHGLTAADAQMAVGCIRMIEPRVSGILFSRGFDDQAADKIVLSVTPGLAEGLTKGSSAAEEITFSPGDDKVQSSLLSLANLVELAWTARRLEEHFHGPQDVEWAFDRAGKLYVLQCRRMAAPPVELQRELKVEDGRAPLLAGGLTACAGVGAGPVFRARQDEDLDRFPDGGVLVAPHSSPKFSRVMTRCAAIVTDRGSPTGHMGILSREFGVPTIVGLADATKILADGQEVTVDAGSARIYAGILADAPKRGGDRRQTQASSPAVQKLRRISQWVTPLKLVDPGSRDFTPANCSSLHDITRYVHEKVFEVMFRMSDRADYDERNAFKLEGRLPYDVWVLDVGGGFADGAGSSGRVSAGEIVSVPLISFLEGLLDPRIKWDQPRAVSARGFMSVLGESMAGPPAEVQGVGRASFAIISDRYMNFSTKAGYHFNTVDTYCGKSLNKNYIHFRFAGGGAAQNRRARRCRFLTLVLEGLDFKVKCRGDLLVARLEKYEREFIKKRLIDLGRLTLCSRQLDMLMDTDQSPDVFARAFLAGELEKF